MKTSFYSIVFSITLTFGCFPTGAQEEGPLAPNGSSFASELKSNLKQTYEIILNQNSSTLERNQAINLLFENVENICIQHCDIAVKTLSEFNDQFPADEKKSQMENLIKISTGREVSNQYLDKVIAPLNFAKKLEDVYNKDPEGIKLKIQASIQAVKVIVNFEQVAIFKAMSAD
ncbi:MAG TPA: hypothetical protein VIG33_03955, partial [Pseudobdellovibrionaceae bacterium]